MRFLLALLFCAELVASTYYVDFASGSDSNAGTSTGAPWKHIKGDANATGNANSVSLANGDVVVFKGGVDYTAAKVDKWTAGGTIWCETAGVTYKGDGAWGTGRPIISGINGATTNYYGLSIGANDITVDGIEFRNLYKAGVSSLDAKSNLTVTNCLFHSIGPLEEIGSGWGVGIAAIYCTNLFIVNNTISNVFWNGIYLNQGIENCVIKGNDISHVGVDALGYGGTGYWVIDGNTIHDTPENGRHNDAMQLLSWPGLLVVCNNTVYNFGNSFFIEPYGPTVTTFEEGKTYQVFTNALYPGGADVRFVYNGNTYTVGQKFTGVNGVTTGSWPANTGGTKELVIAGKGYLFNNVSWTTNTVNMGPGLDTYGEAHTFAVFNNTFLNTYWDNSGRDNWCNLTNGVFKNNLMVDSVRGKIAVGSGTAADDYNWYSTSGYPFGGNLTLAQFQAANSGHETHSLESPVTFRDAANRDYRLSSGSGIGAGENLSGLSVDWSSIPAQWRPDWTLDKSGVARGSVWDIGAYEYAATSGAFSVGTMTITTFRSN